MQQINPPGIVKADCSIKEQAEHVRNLYVSHWRDSEGRARAIGHALLVMKEMCIRAQAGWYETLKEEGIPERSASRYMKDALSPPGEVADRLKMADQDPAESQESGPELPPWQDPSLPLVEDTVVAAKPTPASLNGHAKGNGKPRRPRGTPKSKPEIFKECYAIIGKIVRDVDDAARGDKANRFADESRKLLQILLHTMKAWEKA